MLQSIGDDSVRGVADSVGDVSPELAHQVVAWGFGDLYGRAELAPRDRQLVTLGILTALGGAEPQLSAHINLAITVGLTREEIVEALLHTSIYCGMPRALNATLVAKQVFADRGM